MADLTDQEIDHISLKIISLLEGMPLGQALYCLENTKTFLLDFHAVDSSSPRFKAKVEELTSSLG